ncbi:hypothetical protein [Bradyrhizobium sp. RP6]|uniref:hypothetical protein n=1 Tax=Bradyrhizobium sp. RP6 TaxID=2489596 RepID=UPI000F54928B|nr:hypothetical protein [Bradyrhizobium sp. RP6]RQH14926.1 hypothetical protein EHH60_07030 [Bradyrhizobium sp. RP6]
MFIFWGTFGGGAMAMQSSADNGVTWTNDVGWGSFALEERHFTTGFFLPPCLLRAHLAGVKTSASVSFKIIRHSNGSVSFKSARTTIGGI